MKELANKNISMSHSDNTGGGVVILDEHIYQEKMRDLIDDNDNIYEKVNENKIKKETQKS